MSHSSWNENQMCSWWLYPKPQNIIIATTEQKMLSPGTAGSQVKATSTWWGRKPGWIVALEDRAWTPLLSPISVMGGHQGAPTRATILTGQIFAFVLSPSDLMIQIRQLFFFSAVHSGTPGSGKISPAPYDQCTDSSSPPPQTGRWPLRRPSSFRPTQSESSSSSEHTEVLFQPSQPSAGTMFWLHRLSLGFLLTNLAAAHVGKLAELLTFWDGGDA